ncbi:MAG: A24 family peptidase [Myxococcales bacterium]
MLVVPWSLAVCVIASAVAAFTDLRSRTIPNWLSLPLPLLGIVVHSVSLGLEGMWIACLGCLFCFAPAYLLFARGALGGGDVKLFAGLGALLGPREGLELQLVSFVLVALYAVWTSGWHGRLWALMRASVQASLHLLAPARFTRPGGPEHASVELPMGAAILMAVLLLCLRAWP